MRSVALATLLVLLAVVPARAGEDEGEAAGISQEEALSFLRDLVRRHQGADAEAAWELLDAAAFAERAFAPQLASGDAARRAEVADLVRRGLPALTRRARIEWARPGAVIDDYRATTQDDGIVEATFRWKGAPAGPASRWGVLLARTSSGIRIVDLVFGEPGSLRTGSWALLVSYARYPGPGRDLPAFLRFYFCLPLPETVVPADAPVDWASPDVLALDLVAPTVRGAAPDGWWAEGSRPDGDDGGALAYRFVLHVLATGRAYGRWDRERWGDGRALPAGSLLGGNVASTLAALQIGAPLLIRADHRTPWAAVGAVLEGLPRGARSHVAFSVLRVEAEGPPRYGQVGLTAEGVLPVASSRAALEALGGLERPTVRRDPPAANLTVRLVSRPADDGTRATWMHVADTPVRPLPSDLADRAVVLDALAEEVVRAFEKRRLARVTLDLLSPAGDDVPHGDVVHVLAALHVLPGVVTEVALPRRAGPAAARSRVTWTLPAGWVRRPDRPLREVTVAPAGKDGVSCYVTLLQGTGGGWKANLRRWYAKMDAPIPDDAALDATARWTVDGHDAYFVAIPGPATQGTLLYGLICPFEAATLFVKMVGPRADLEPERARFEAFATSLKLD